MAITQGRVMARAPAANTATTGRECNRAHQKMGTYELYSFKKVSTWNAFVGILEPNGAPWGNKSTWTPLQVLEDSGLNPGQHTVWGVAYQRRAKWDEWTSESDICSRALSAGKPGLWLMFTESRRRGPPYLRCFAESQSSGIVLWLFGFYLVIRPLKSIGGMKALLC